MIDQNSQLTMTPNETINYTRRVRQVGLVLTIVAVITTLFYLYLALSGSQWQLYGIVVAAMVTLLGGLGGLRFGGQQRIGLAAWSVTLGISLAFLTFTIFIADFGLFLGVVTVVMTSMIASYILPPSQVARAVVVSVIFGVLMGLLDVVQPGFRITEPRLNAYVPIALGLMILIYGIYVVRRFQDFSLRTKLILIFLALVLIPEGIITYVNAVGIEGALKDEVDERLMGSASQTAATLDAFFDFNLEAVNAEAQFPDFIAALSTQSHEHDHGDDHHDDHAAIQADDYSHVTGALTSLNNRNETFIKSYGLLDKAGINIADSSADNVGLSEANQDYFQTPVDTGEPYVSPVRFSDRTGEPEFYFSAPTRDEIGNIIGVLRVRYDGAILEDLLRQSTERIVAFSLEEGDASMTRPPSVILLDENYIRLVDLSVPKLNYTSVTPFSEVETRQLQASGRLPDGPVDQLSTDLPDFAIGLANAEKNPTTFTGIAHPDQPLEQGAVVKLQTQPGWLVAFVQPQSVFLDTVQRQVQTTILSAIIIAGVAAVLAVVLAQLLVRPLIQLTELAQKAASGDLSGRASITTRDETGQLAEAFNGMTNQLKNLVNSLETQVQDRTADLSVSMELGQRAAAIRDLDVLLPTMVDQILDRFELYYVQIYLIDDVRQRLNLAAGTGEVGEEMLARRYSFPIDQTSMIGTVAATSKPIVVPDISRNDLYRLNPLLPDTRSELTIPLIVEAQVIGVLDMQCTNLNTFTEENLTVFEAMATQLAISIDSAKQWAVAQEAQQQLEIVVNRLTRDAWATKLEQEDQLGFVYDLSSTQPTTENGDQGGVVVPVKVSNQTIGQLAVEPPKERPFSTDEIALLTAVARQLGQKAETLRLFDATQATATREQLARQIADKVRASRDVESALKTAAEELRKALGTTRTVVDFSVKS